MESWFIRLYRFFKSRQALLWSVFAGVMLLLGAGASQIKLEEDITRFFPDDERVEKLNYVFQHSRFVERMVVMVSIKDSTISPEPDSLVSVAGILSEKITSQLKPYISEVTTMVDDARIMEVFDAVHDHLPLYLEEKDYQYLDSLTNHPEAVDAVLGGHHRQLISPTGVVTKKVILEDPLGFSFLVLRKLQQLQYDENFVLYDNFILTKDHRHLIFFIQPVYSAGNTGENRKLMDGLDLLMDSVSASHPVVHASYFGAPAVAVGNAVQLRADTFLTLGIMVALLAIFLLGFFRKKRIPFLIFVPVVFGALFSLFCIYVMKGSVSILALAAGSVILGIAVNYSLHFLAHLKHTHSTESVIRDLVKPMTLGSATTVLAFFCLQFVNAAVLRDVGLFAGFSLIGAVLCSLIFLPHFIGENIFKSAGTENILERAMQISIRPGRYLVPVIFLLTPVFLFFAADVRFNSDMNKLNFMRPEVREAQKRLESINHASLNSIYIVSEGKTLDEALRRNEQTMPVLENLRASGDIDKFSTVSSFLLSDSLQRARISRWNTFWTPVRRAKISASVREKGSHYGFSPRVFQNFDSLLVKPFGPADVKTASIFRSAFFDDHIIEKDGRATVISLANVAPSRKPYVYEHLNKTPAHGFDRQMITGLFVDYIHDDFNFIVTVTSLLVFLALLISYGRIELTLITFIPMLITWIWILGIMALLGIEFNIINVMVSTFIFGLGDDYSIFTMDGLQDAYARGRNTLPSIRTSILLSALTTISGLGVLIFAQHPALRSIATISIIGIVCVFVMSQTVEPYLFGRLITGRTKKGFAPATFKGIAWTVFTYAFFVLGSIVLTLIGLLFKIIPVGRKKIRLRYHTLISGFVRLLVYSGLNVKKEVRNQSGNTFGTPGVVIANHSSFMDILTTIMLHPRLILLTNKWVWNSPLFGGVVRLADYYPVMEGAEDSAEHLRGRVAEGYSIMVFPEGTRSADKTIGRFHKGAFFLAELLNIPVRPLLIHGAGDVIRKGEMIVNDGKITLEFLPDISTSNDAYGVGYAERTKRISRYFKEQHARLARAEETPDYFRYKLLSNYIYKGPVLEWYARIKTRLEDNYKPFDALIPRDASVLDLGCGYGFLSYMLHFVSPGRKITGVDYDEEKIETASHNYSRKEQLQFVHADVTTFSPEGYDVIVLADVLHYLATDAQENLLVRCFHALADGGMLIVREGDTALGKRHAGTRLTEFFSVNVLGFNKSTTKLNFVSREFIIGLAKKHKMSVTISDNTIMTSNVIFVIRKGVGAEN